jgi:SAM-dependent methyltransferase
MASVEICHPSRKIEMKKITYDIEWGLERSHWWFVGKRKLLESLISSLDIRNNSIILDIGCGVGSNLSLLTLKSSRVLGVDSEIYSLSLAKKRFSTVPLINGDLQKLPLKSDSIDCILATDILEHVDEDTVGIKEIYRTLRNEGKVIFTVPAFGFLWGIQDIVGMHKRRYGKKILIKKLEKEGFNVLRVSYSNFFLFFPILIARRIIQILGLKIRSENEINSPLINYFLKEIFSFEPYLLKYFSFPFGVTIFCIAKKRVTKGSIID